jgi:Magnesium chelatase, subunit ChlI
MAIRRFIGRAHASNREVLGMRRIADHETTVPMMRPCRGHAAARPRAGDVVGERRQPMRLAPFARQLIAGGRQLGRRVRHSDQVQTTSASPCGCSVHHGLLLGPPGPGTSMLARRRTTMLPVMTLAQAIEITRMHRVAGLTALVTTRPCRPPSHNLRGEPDGWGPVPRPGDVSLAHHGCSSWTNCRSSNATPWRSCASRSRMASQQYNLPHVIDPAALAALAARMQVSTAKLTS